MKNPTLAKEFNAHKHKLEYPILSLPKLDGVRAVFRRVLPGDTYAGKRGQTEEVVDDGQYHFFSRNQKMWDDNVVAHILNPLRETISIEDNLWLDGEFYKHGYHRTEITGATQIARTAPRDEEEQYNRKGVKQYDLFTRDVEYHIFDALGAAETLRYEDRMMVAAVAMNKFPASSMGTVHLVGWNVVHSEDEILHNHALYLEAGYEGSIIRVPNNPYLKKRTDQLLKLKDWQEEEFPIVGFVEGRETDLGSKHLGRLGAVILHNPMNDRTFQCGSGFDDVERQHIWDNQDAFMGKQVTVRYFELHPETGNPQHPTAQGIRDYE